MIERAGIRLRQLRKEKGLTLKQVADAIGTSIGTIGDLESGKAKNPRGDTLLALAKLFNVSPAWLQTGKGDREMRATSEDEEDLLALFRAMPPAQQRQLLKMGRVLRYDEDDNQNQDEAKEPRNLPKH